MSGAAGVTGVAGAQVWARSAGPLGRSAEEGRPRTGWAGGVLTWLKGPVEGLPTATPGPLITAPARRGRVSAHGGSGSSRRGLPQQRLTGWPAAAPRAHAGRSRSHRLPGTRRAPLRSPARRRQAQIPAAVSGSAGAGAQRCGGWRRSDPERRERRGAASTARAPVATAELRGACARRGRGARACVCVGAGWAAALLVQS